MIVASVCARARACVHEQAILVYQRNGQVQAMLYVCVCEFCMCVYFHPSKQVFQLKNGMCLNGLLYVGVCSMIVAHVLRGFNGYI